MPVEKNVAGGKLEKNLFSVKKEPHYAGVKGLTSARSNILEPPLHLGRREVMFFIKRNLMLPVSLFT